MNYFCEIQAHDCIFVVMMMVVLDRKGGFIEKHDELGTALENTPVFT